MARKKEDIAQPPKPADIIWDSCRAAREEEAERKKRGIARLDRAAQALGFKPSADKNDKCWFKDCPHCGTQIVLSDNRDSSGVDVLTRGDSKCTAVRGIQLWLRDNGYRP